LIKYLYLNFYAFVIIILMKSTRNGLFIALEGPDGGGKSTILKMLNEAINNDYTQLKVVITREPGGTNNAIAEDIRNILLNKPGVSIDYYAEALLFAASRSQHVSDFISPNLELGNIVITDRYVLSSLAYQGVGRDLGIDQV
jgi:dTMP kinase